MRKNLLFSLLIVLFTINTNAQIVYTDINPDGMPTNGGFDFNNDGTNEYALSNSDYFDYTTSPAGTNIWANGTAGGGWDVPKPISLNTIIDNSGNFIGAGDASMNNWGQGTPFPLNQDSYIGCKLSLGGQTHFGWIRVMWNGTNFIYKDFAYNSTPGATINAGQTVLNINKYDLTKQISIYPNPAKDKITIENKLLINISGIKLIDITGKDVKSFTFLNLNNNTIDVSDLNQGIYFINIYSNKHLIDVKKIIINK